MASVFKLVTFNVLLFTCFVYGVPDPEDHVPGKLQRHFIRQEHDPNYDHKAFLGQEAEEFDIPTREESQRRLGLIVNKIDKNNDGFVTEDELKNWITFVNKRSTMNYVEQLFNNYKKSAGEKISWAEYYPEYNIDDHSFMGDEEAYDVQKQDYSYAKLVKRDARRWAAADVDGDGLLTKYEYFSFLYPEKSDHTKEIFLIELMDNMDKDKDGKISIDEYMEYLYAGLDKSRTNEGMGITLKEHIKTYKDKDGDGFLDIGEIKDSVLSTKYAEIESRHLIYGSDSDADGKLTKNEILEKYHLFVGSPDFGESIKKEYFETYIDKDWNEFLDIEKAKDWVVPEKLDHAEVESRHLVYESDSDADGKLTKNEILENYHLFVGSPPADFEEAIVKIEL